MKHCLIPAQRIFLESSEKLLTKNIYILRYQHSNCTEVKNVEIIAKSIENATNRKRHRKEAPPLLSSEYC